MLKILSFILGGISILMLLYVALASAKPATNIKASEIIEVINSERRKLNIEELKPDESLMQAAQIKAEDMARRKYISNMDPENNSTWELVKKNNYNYFIIGENLILTDLRSKDIVLNQMKINSVHKDNLLNQSFDDVGIGLARYGKYKENDNLYIVVGLFANKENNTNSEDIQKTIPAGEIILKKDLAINNYILFFAIMLMIVSIILFTRSVV